MCFANKSNIMENLILDLFCVIGVMGIGGVVEWGIEYRKR